MNNKAKSTMDFEMERRFQMVDLDRKAEMDKVSANVHYQIAQNFTEQDAEATIRAMVEKYPGIVMKVLSKRYIKNLATLDAMHAFLSDWSGT